MRESDSLKRATVNPYHGLCSTCSRWATCTYPIPKDRPVLFCEEFEGLCNNMMAPGNPVATSVWKPNPEAVRAKPAPQAEPPEQPSRFKGLCRTCGNRETCTFPKPAGGVWHCEEFV